MLVFVMEFGSKVVMTMEQEYPSFLELKSIGRPALEGYIKPLGVFAGVGPIPQTVMSNPARLDEKLTNWMNTAFLQGRCPWNGGKLLAAIAAFSLHYGMVCGSYHGRFAASKAGGK